MTSMIDWSKFDKGLRLHFAEEPETVTPAHVLQAMHDCDRINREGRQWAILETVPTANGPVVRLEVGNILSGGFRECKIQTWSYTLNKDGSVYVYKHTHP
jgi:hypothetical protein